MTQPTIKYLNFGGSCGNMIENCKMRHENGNCLPAGGFCAANKGICEALQNAYEMGQENARRSMLFTLFDYQGRIIDTSTCVDLYKRFKQYLYEGYLEKRK